MRVSDTRCAAGGGGADRLELLKRVGGAELGHLGVHLADQAVHALVLLDQAWSRRGDCRIGGGRERGLAPARNSPVCDPTVSSTLAPGVLKPPKGAATPPLVPPPFGAFGGSLSDAIDPV